MRYEGKLLKVFSENKENGCQDFDCDFNQNKFFDQFTLTRMA